MNAIHPIPTALPKAMSRDDRRKAYGYAEDFFAAMGDALEAEEELSGPEDDKFDHRFWRQCYEAALGKAVVALQKMPTVWSVLLHAEVPAGALIAAGS